MADIQGGYAATIRKAVLGQVANTLTADIVSRQCEVVAGVAFGTALIQGAADAGVTVGDDGVFIGFAVREPALPPENGDKFLLGNTIPVLSRGPIWVTTLAACVAGAPVYRTPAGAVTPTALNNVLIDGARFETSTAANGLARVALH